MKNQKNIALIINEDCNFPADYKEHLIEEIDELQDHSCDNIYVGDLLDYLEKETTEDLIKKIFAKNKIQDGRIHIKAPDIMQTCWYASRMNLDITQLRYILYHSRRKNCYTVDEIISIINSIDGVIIESASYVNGYEYSITISTHETN